MKLSKKDKANLEKEISKQIKTNGKVLAALKQNKGKLKKVGMKIKATTWIDPSTGEKRFGGSIELIETKSENKWLDGINLDVGATNDLHIMLGISKDIDIAGGEFSIGGYIDIVDTGMQLYNRIFKKSNKDLDISVNVGISKTF